MTNYEWDQEPNSKQFVYNGFPCVILRNPDTKFLCGYMGLTQFQRKALTDNLGEIKVHGGITYDQMGLREFDSRGAFHWIGFDCGHMGDTIPLLIEYVDKGLIKQDIINYSQPSFSPMFKGIYRNIDFVKHEIIDMVDQVVSLLSPKFFVMKEDL